MKNLHAYLLSAVLAIPLVALTLPLALRAQTTSYWLQLTPNAGVCCEDKDNKRTRHLALECRTDLGETEIKMADKRLCGVTKTTVTEPVDNGPVDREGGSSSSIRLMVDDAVCCRHALFNESDKEVSHWYEMQLGPVCSFGEQNQKVKRQVDVRYCRGDSKLIDEGFGDDPVCCLLPGSQTGQYKTRSASLEIHHFSRREKSCC